MNEQPKDDEPLSSASVINFDAGVVHVSTDEWRPISTAPRDGTEFLAFDPVVGKCDVCRMEDWHAMGWLCVPTQMDGNWGPHVSEFQGSRATYWHPLPRAPVGGS